MLWIKLKNVQLKKYQEYKPGESFLPIIQKVIIIVFILFVAVNLYWILTAVKLRYCDIYEEPKKGVCIKCPPGKYCSDGKIQSFDEDDPVISDVSNILGSIKQFFKKSLIVFGILGLILMILYAVNSRRVWTDKQIKMAETIYKELLYELKNSSTGMIKKSVFARKFDKDYSPVERKFLESKLEQIRVIDEQITFINDDGELNYIFLTE